MPRPARRTLYCLAFCAVLLKHGIQIKFNKRDLIKQSPKRAAVAVYQVVAFHVARLAIVLPRLVFAFTRRPI